MSARSGFELTDRAQQALSNALQLAKDYAHANLYPVHIALALLTEDSANLQQQQGSIPGGSTPSRPGTPATPARAAGNQSLFRSVLSKAGADSFKLENSLREALRKIPSQSPAPDEVSLSSAASKLLKKAEDLKTSQHDAYIAQDHLLLALMDDASVKPLLQQAGLANDQLLKTAILQSRGQRRIDSKSAEAGFEALQKYCVDLTDMAAEGKLDPVIGRDAEIRRVIRVLSRRRKNCACLVGEAGVGKTAIAEGLAQRIIERDCPPSLLGRLLSLDLGALMAGASYKGEYEERVKSVINELEKAADDGTIVILFIDEMHLIVSGGGSSGMDAANLFKPALARGKIKVIGATTLREYKTAIEKDAALDRRFQSVFVNEPDEQATLAILRGVREKYEIHAGVRILDSSLVSAVQLAKRYLPYRHAPDSALDLIDEACAEVATNRDTLPEELDKLQRHKMQLEVAIHALEREKDKASKESLEATKRELATLEDELGPKMAEHEAEKSKHDELANARRRLEDVRSKADAAERRYDVQTSADLRYYAIPDLEARIKQLEEEERRKAEKGEVDANTTVTPEVVATVVARWTGIPVKSMLESEKQRILKLPKLLGKEIVGQPEAVQAIANAIQMSRAGLQNPNQPASFLFLGSSGSGKTLCAKTLAKLLFNDEKALVRIDSSEYSEKHSVSRLFGSPPGYVGHGEPGALEAVRQRPYSIILVDEIEKGHPQTYLTAWLQILDDGRATDGQGRLIDFSQSIIIFTSNLGSQFINDAEEGEELSDSTRSLIEGTVSSAMPPEFRNRISATVIFRRLTRDNVRAIIDLRIREIEERSRKNGKDLRFNVSDEAKEFLASVGYSPSLGARPLMRAINQYILSPLSILLLRGEVLDGEKVNIVFDPINNRPIVQKNHDIPRDEEGDVEMSEDEDDEAYIVEEPLD
ncbi:P-loop containing nucleoside triphosphate hydrolase protein [Meira miltonrushii]|uniref:P-loop containing nucleoside triphosphate hydrolase protein n=1 Tax=Meira miltonrushii TaxID=1280837 RepID=A0A316V4J2_9BASI|nr:P-loop containing nucleoside triphosphate hydrolase protein [Meira miltonrushii]PWN32440.1 P-loop containing nucleoside triphosphate hydrolase protein [Meira miltonrushii]